MSQVKLKIKNRIKKSIFKLKGADKGIHVLTYHGLIDEITQPRLQRNFHTISAFKEQMHLIKKSGAKVLSPQEFDFHVGNNSIHQIKKAFLLTFDDGYRNNLLAMEILYEFGYNATYFISTDSIGSSSSVWTVNLSLLLLYGSLKLVVYSGKSYQLDSDKSRNEAFNAIRYNLKAASGVDRIDGYQSIVSQFPNGELESLIQKYSCFKMMTKNDISQASASGQNIQSHGVLHELLHQNQTQEVVLAELIKSKQKLEENTKKEVSWYAYPNGDHTFPGLAQMAEEAGYKKAFCLDYKSFDKTDSMFHIPRYNATQLSTNLLF